MTVVRRNDVVDRLSKSHNQEIKQVIEQLNTRLSTCTELPLTVSASVLGKTLAVRSPVINQLKEAGWRVSPVDNTASSNVQLGSDVLYEIA